MGQVFLSVLCFFSGIALCALSFTESTEFFGAVSTFACGLVMLFGGFIFFGEGAEEASKKLNDWKKQLSFKLEGDPDQSDIERACTDYRSKLQQYFASGSKDIFSCVTKRFANVLEAQKQRLDQFSIDCSFESERKRYTDNSSVKVDSSEKQCYHVDEDIYAKQTFRNPGQITLTKEYSQLAHYFMLDDEKGNLKVDGFSFTAKYETSKGKYKKIRKIIKQWTTIIVGLIVFVCCIVALVPMMPEMVEENDSILFMIAVGGITVLLGTVMVTFIVVLNISMFVMPLMHFTAALNLLPKKVMEALAKQQDKDEQMEKQVRLHDSKFCINHFFAEIQNDISQLHYSPIDVQLKFVSGDMTDYLVTCQNVIDVEFGKIALKDYSVADCMQRAVIEAELMIVIYENGGFYQKKEQIELHATKPLAYTNDDYWIIEG